VGVPLYFFVGSVDDEISHEGPAFNRDLVKTGYTIDVVSTDGYTVTFDAQRVQYNKNILVAYKVNDNALPEEYFPLRLVGDDLEKQEMVGMISVIKVGLKPLPAATPAPVTLSAENATLTVTGLVNQELFLNEAALRGLEVVTINAEKPKGGKSDFEGVRLSALLAMTGVKDGATTLRITASDGYYVEVSLKDLQACADCLLGFTDTAENFKVVMPGMTSDMWVKDVVKLQVK
jgi:hypothetical protein